MPLYNVVTEEKVKRGYQIVANSADEARERFENGEVTEFVYDDVLDHEIIDVQEEGED